MLDKLLAAAATNAKLAIAAAAGAALVATGSAAVVVQNVADSSASGQGAAASLAQGENRSDTATATIGAKPTKSPEPSKSPKADNEGKGAHGACVSAVARDKSAQIDGSHGKAVSAAARTLCPKGGANKADKPAKTRGADEAEDGRGGPSETGIEHGQGHDKR